jgi:hypothetical protein
MEACATTGCEQLGPDSLRPLGRPHRVAGATWAHEGWCVVSGQAHPTRIPAGRTSVGPRTSTPTPSQPVSMSRLSTQVLRPRARSGGRRCALVDPIASGFKTIISGHLQNPISNAPYARAREAEKPGVDGLWGPMGSAFPGARDLDRRRCGLDTSPDQHIRTFQLLRLRRELTSSLHLVRSLTPRAIGFR